MNEEKTGPGNLLDTTDCLEAIGVFRWWKNLLFLIVVLCLLLLQGSFWLVETGCIKTSGEEVKIDTSVVASETAKPTGETAKQAPIATADKIAEAAKQVTAGPNQPVKEAPQERPARKIAVILGVKFENLAWLIRLFNFVLVPSAVLYCLTMLFCLKVSLVGRLGGINHISRAFFISLTMLVFLLPWYKLSSGAFVGALYGPQELSTSCNPADICKEFTPMILHYLRFTGLWLLVVLLLVLSQIRSARWAKTILRRLEVV
jgi:hypothetical protein